MLRCVKENVPVLQLFTPYGVCLIISHAVYQLTRYTLAIVLFCMNQCSIRDIFTGLYQAEDGHKARNFLLDKNKKNFANGITSMEWRNTMETEVS